MSIFDHPDGVPAVPSWRCPHCAQLQAETSRCWRCGRSAVSCSTCYRFRAAVADDMGYCLSDRTRAPLTGDEIRSCWRAVAEAPAASGLFDTLDPPAAAPIPQPRPQPRPRRRAKAPKPPVQEVQAAAWAEGPSGELVDAPHVEAGKRDASTRQRRRRRFWGR